jgi:tetratricopeptide (TPR) repeat protein
MKAWIVVLALGGVAYADDKQKQSNDLFEAGRDKLKAGQPEEACKLFGQAILLDPGAPGVMLNLGLCNEKLGKFKTALYWFRKAEHRATEVNPPLPDHEKAAKEHAAVLAGEVAHVSIAFEGGEPPGAIVKIDGDPVAPDDYRSVEIDTGHHVLSAGAPGMKIVRREFDVEGHGGETLRLQFVPGDNATYVDRGKTRRTYGLAIGIGGIAALTTGSVWVGIERSLYFKYRDAALKGDLNAIQRTNDAIHAARWYCTPLIVGGLLATAAGAYMYFGAPSKERIEQTVFAPTVSPEGIGFAASGSF